MPRRLRPRSGERPALWRSAHGSWRTALSRHGRLHGRKADCAWRNCSQDRITLANRIEYLARPDMNDKAAEDDPRPLHCARWQSSAVMERAKAVLAGDRLDGAEIAAAVTATVQATESPADRLERMLGRKHRLRAKARVRDAHRESADDRPKMLGRLRMHRMDDNAGLLRTKI